MFITRVQADRMIGPSNRDWSPSPIDFFNIIESEVEIKERKKQKSQ